MARSECGADPEPVTAGPFGRLVRIERGEGAAVFWAFAYFFLLLSSYYLIRPLRDALGLAGSEGGLTWLFLGTLAGTLVANPVFSALVARYPRGVFIPIVYRFLAVNLLLFWAALGAVSPERNVVAGYAFFVWASVFNLFAVSVFWGFMADLFRSGQGKRLFGFIGMGGTLGATTGAALAAGLASHVGPANLLLLSAALLEGSVYCVRRLNARYEGAGARLEGVGAPRGAPGGERTPGPPAGDDAGTRPARGARPGAAPRGALQGIRLVAASPYLLGICLFLVLYTVSSTLLYFEQARIVRASFEDTATRTAFFARIDLFTNLLTVVTQAFLSGRILTKLGVGATLALLPVLTLAGFGALGAAPVPWMLLWFQVARRGTEYALVRPAREVLFTVVTRDEKYAAKNLIDTFVYRGGDAVGALLDRLLAILTLGVGGLALAFAPIAALWAATGWLLGRAHASR